MTEQEILEYNERCLKILPFKYKNQSKYWVIYRYDDNSFFGKNRRYLAVNSLKFHSDWNWIMEVVEKIQTLDKLGGIVMIQQGRCRITSRMAGDNTVYADVSYYYLHGMRKQKEAVVQAINQFLIWYNNEH